MDEVDTRHPSHIAKNRGFARFPVALSVIVRAPLFPGRDLWGTERNIRDRPDSR